MEVMQQCGCQLPPNTARKKEEEEEVAWLVSFVCHFIQKLFNFYVKKNNKIIIIIMTFVICGLLQAKRNQVMEARTHNRSSRIIQK